MSDQSYHRTKFGRDVLITAAATVLRSMRNLIMLPILTRGLSVGGFGLWEQVVLGVGIVVSWSSLRLPGAITRFLPGNDNRDEIREGFYSVLVFVVLSGGVIALVLWLSLSILGQFPRLQPVLDHAPIILLLIPISSAVPVILAYFRAYRHVKAHATLMLFQHFSEIALVAISLNLGYGLGGVLMSIAAVRVGLILLGGIIIAKQIGVFVPRFRLIRGYLRYCLPLLPNESFNRLFDAADRYILSYFLGNVAVGIYTVAYTASGVFGTIMAPLHFVLLPLVAELWNRDKLSELREYVTQAIRYSLMVSLPALAGGILLAEPILLVLVPTAYKDSIALFPFLAGGFLLFGIGVIGEHVLMTTGRGRAVMTVTGSLTAINIILNFLLIPKVGIRGAVFSTLASQAFYAVLMLRLSQVELGYAFPWRAAAHFVVLTLVMTATLQLMLAYVSPPMAVTVGTGVVLYVSMLIGTGGVEKNEIRYFASLVARRNG